MELFVIMFVAFGIISLLIGAIEENFGSFIITAICIAGLVICYLYDCNVTAFLAS